MASRAIALRALALATLVAFAGVTAYVAPVAAVDPSPTPTPTATATPTPTPVATASTSPAPTPDPSATVVPSPDATATPTTAPVSTAPAPAPLATTQTAQAVVAPVVKPNIRGLIVRIAMAQRGKRYAFGASGPRAFDCSGLVRYVYRQAHVANRIGGGHSARGMLIWARRHHLVSRSNPRVGDLVIYGNGSHVAIYIGRGLVISALNPRQGVRVTRLHALRAPVTAFIHTHL